MKRWLKITSCVVLALALTSCSETAPWYGKDEPISILKEWPMVIRMFHRFISASGTATFW